MRLSLHRAMLTYGGGLFLHTAASGRVAGLDSLYLRLLDDEGVEAVGEVRINIAYLNGLAAESVLAEALGLLPRLDLSGEPEKLISDPPADLASASAPLRMLVDMALHDHVAKRAGLTLVEWMVRTNPHPSPLPTRGRGAPGSPPDTRSLVACEAETSPNPPPPCGEGLGVGVRTRADIAEAISHPTNQTLSISDDATYLARAVAYVSRGFRDLKVRIGAGDFADDLRRLRLLRDRFGDDVELSADANGAWSREEALRRIESLEPLRLAYLEQPVAPCPFDELARLAERSPIPIMLDESVGDDRAVDDLCAGGHRLMAHLKLVKLGGLGPTIDAARRLGAAGVPVMIGQMNEGGLATAAALHACAALRPRFAELYGADGLENDPAPGLVYSEGTVAVPARPGLGLGFIADRTQTLWEDER